MNGKDGTARQALDRVLDLHSKSDYAARYLSVRKAGRIDLVALDDLRYIQGAGSYRD